MHPGFADSVLWLSNLILIRIQDLAVATIEYKPSVFTISQVRGYAVVAAGGGVGGTEYRNHHLITKRGQVASLTIMSVWECR